MDGIKWNPGCPPAEQTASEALAYVAEGEERDAKTAAVIAELEDKGLKLEAQLSSAQDRIANLQRDLDALLASTSWRATAPLRFIHLRFPGLHRLLRRSLTLAWWTMTSRLPLRLRERKRRAIIVEPDVAQRLVAGSDEARSVVEYPSAGPIRSWAREPQASRSEGGTAEIFGRKLRAEGPYILDVGLHIGDDTDFYLKKGFEVVAVEANPQLAAQCEQRFSSAIAEGRLVIVNGAITSRGENFPFFINPRLTEWSSADRSLAARDGGAVEEISVPGIDLGDVIKNFGQPYYVKIDIEGADRIALSQIPKEYLPKYFSMESNSISPLVDLHDMGYNRFKVVNQANYYAFKPPFPALEGEYVEHTFSIHSSGLFGEETAGHWVDYETAALTFLTLRRLDKENPLLVIEWIDFHATR
ncbi:MAG: FkbM family methyltransferase [Roseiarcus sp.]